MSFRRSLKQEGGEKDEGLPSCSSSSKRAAQWSRLAGAFLIGIATARFAGQGANQLSSFASSALLEIDGIMRPEPLYRTQVPQCPAQPPARAPSSIWKPEDDAEYVDAAAERLGGAVRIQTVSYDGMGEPEDDERYKVFADMHDYLAATFPLLHAAAPPRKVNSWGLLWKIPGSDPALKPALLVAHQDVVPVQEQTLDQWEQPPFSGFYDNTTGLVWGRGSSDDKSMLLAILSALEQLLSEGFENKRTIYMASGFDEEVGGPRGAGSIGALLREELQGEDPIEYVIDEGGLGISVEQGVLDLAMPAVAEKGYADVEITIRAPGGHSSMPPDHTAIGILSSFLHLLEETPPAPELSPRNPILTHLICMADALEEHDKHERRWWRTVLSPLQRSTPSSPPIVGFKMDKWMRKDLRHPGRWGSVARRIAAEGTRAQHYVLQTSQAADIIVGGAKANALPEFARAVVNHRISVEGSVNGTHERLTRLLGEVAEKRYGLTVIGFGERPEDKKPNPIGTMQLATTQFREPSRVSSATTPQFGRLAATIRHVYPGRNGKERLVTPVIMTGNTDTRHYQYLSANVWRFNPNTYSAQSAKHTVNENMDIIAHVRSARFMHALVRNMDDPL